MNTTLKRSIRLSIAALLAVPFIASAATSSGDNTNQQNPNAYLAGNVNVPEVVQAMNKYTGMVQMPGTKTYFNYMGAVKLKTQYSQRAIAYPDKVHYFGHEKTDNGYDKGGKLDGSFDGSFIGFNTRTDLANGSHVRSSVVLGVDTDVKDYGSWTAYGIEVQGLTVSYDNIMAGLTISNFVDPMSMSQSYVANGGFSFLNQLQIRYTVPMGDTTLSIAAEKADTNFTSQSYNPNSKPYMTQVYDAYDYFPDITARLTYMWGAGNSVAVSGAITQNRVAASGLCGGSPQNCHSGGSTSFADGSNGQIYNGKMGYAGAIGLRLATFGKDAFTINLAGMEGAAKYLGVTYAGYDGYIVDSVTGTAAAGDLKVTKINDMKLDKGYSIDAGYVHWWSKKMWSSLSLGFQKTNPHDKTGAVGNGAGGILDGSNAKTLVVAAANLNYQLTSHLNVAGQYTYMHKKDYNNDIGYNQIFGIYAQFTF